jgi:hypothetical protein
MGRSAPLTQLVTLAKRLEQKSAATDTTRFVVKLCHDFTATAFAPESTERFPPARGMTALRIARRTAPGGHCSVSAEFPSTAERKPFGPELTAEGLCPTVCGFGFGARENFRVTNALSEARIQ